MKTTFRSNPCAALSSPFFLLIHRDSTRVSPSRNRNPFVITTQMSSSDTTHWQSSVLPLFVRTVWTDGHHHVLLRQEDSVLKVRNCKNKRKRVVSDSISEKEIGFRLASVKLPLENCNNRKSEDQEIIIKPFTETPVCSKLIRYKLTVKPIAQEASSPLPPPNNALSERVMMWLDLAYNSDKPPKVEIVKKSRRAATAKQKKVEIVLSPKSPIKEKLSRVSERKVEADLREVVTKVKRQVLETKRELHIFLPNIPKKLGSDVSSVVSSKCSSLKK